MSKWAASAKPLSLQRSNCIFSKPVMTLPDFSFSQGLYHPANEHDACGVGFVAHIKGKKAHSIVEQGLAVLKYHRHRAAVAEVLQHRGSLLDDGVRLLALDVRDE